MDGSRPIGKLLWKLFGRSINSKIISRHSRVLLLLLLGNRSPNRPLRSLLLDSEAEQLLLQGVGHLGRVVRGDAL